MKSMRRKDVRQAIKGMCDNVREAIEKDCMQLWDKMTPEEVAKCAEDPTDGSLHAYRFAKAVLLTVTPETIAQFYGDALKKNLAVAKKVKNTNRDQKAI